MLKKIFPFIGWFKSYNKDKLKQDLVAGLTVALILIPQSMAYAQLAGLPSYYGLYAAFLPPLFAALFGSSYQLSTGPVAVVSLMTAATLEPLATAGSAGFIEYAIVLALIVGLFQLALGIFRLGLIVNFISHPVINGFTNAAAIIIAGSQLTRLLGVYIDDAEHFYDTIWKIILAAIVYIHIPTVLMGGGAILIMVIMRKYAPKLPSVLIAVLVTTVISWGIGFEHNYFTKLEDIRSESFQNLVHNFNKQVKIIDKDLKERSGISEKIGAMRKAVNNYQSFIDMEYYDASLGYRIGVEREETHNLREAIWRYRFEGIDSAGKILFYELGKAPKGAKNDGRRWMMRVASQELNVNSLSMKGGGSVVGDIPKGLPTFSMPSISYNLFVKLLPYAIIISLLGFMEAISIAKAMAAKTGQSIDPNRELIGQGIANIIGSFGRSYPVSGSFSRSAVNFQAGAVTGMSSVIASLFVVITLFYLTPLMHHLPKAVLSAIIMVAVIGIINFKSFREAGKVKWYDGMISYATFFATLYFAPHLDKGIMIGAGLSIGIFLYRSMRPKVVSLSMAQDFTLVPANEYKLEECSHIAAIRFDGTLFFANASYLEDKVLEIISKKPKLKHILIICSGINDIDSSGAKSLSLLIKRMQSAGYGISLSGVNEKVMKCLEKSRITDLLGENNIYPHREEAIEDIFNKTHAPGSTNAYACPLMNYLPKPKSDEDDKPSIGEILDEAEPDMLILTHVIGTEELRKKSEGKEDKNN